MIDGQRNKGWMDGCGWMIDGQRNKGLMDGWMWMDDRRTKE